MDKVVDLVKAGKLREISDMRDETDLDGLKITIDLKRGADPDKLMQKLFRFTPLEDSFSCNFNVLIAGAPRVLGVRETAERMDRLPAWSASGAGSTSTSAKEQGKAAPAARACAKILLDIDKAVRIVRETEEEAEVVPNLMIGFGIDEIQAEYVAEIKLRHLNREYILKRTEEIGHAEGRDRGHGGDPGLPQKDQGAHRPTSCARSAKTYGKPRRSLIIVRRMKTRRTPRARRVPDYPVQPVLHRGRVFQEDHPLIACA